ncbi:hypothetical protein [uncultured Sphingomonas sp.]|uniref:hypothetical protein n=1 Tax=uncultured Sphingomonas sp. TaxID=158754 RepID=UPI0035CAE4A4
MRFALLLILLATPAFAAVESGHSGVVHPRTGPALSDIALFVCAAVGVWLARRALRARFRNKAKPGKD